MPNGNSQRAAQTLESESTAYKWRLNREVRAALLGGATECPEDNLGELT